MHMLKPHGANLLVSVALGKFEMILFTMLPRCCRGHLAPVGGSGHVIATLLLLNIEHVGRKTQVLVLLLLGDPFWG